MRLSLQNVASEKQRCNGLIVGPTGFRHNFCPLYRYQYSLVSWHIPAGTLFNDNNPYSRFTLPTGLFRPVINPRSHAWKLAAMPEQVSSWLHRNGSICIENVLKPCTLMRMQQIVQVSRNPAVGTTLGLHVEAYIATDGYKSCPAAAAALSTLSHCSLNPHLHRIHIYSLIMKLLPVASGLGALAALASAAAMPDNHMGSDLVERCATSDLQERTLFAGGWCFSVLGLR